MDLKWQLALLSMRTKRFFQKTDKKITINGSDTVGYDKSKVECFNYHKLGHFARECIVSRNQDNRNRNQDSSRRTVNVKETSSKAMVAIDGAGFDCSYMADDEVPTNMTLMAFSDSEVHNDKTCSKTCLKRFETLKTQLDDLRIEFNKSEFNLATYKRGLASVEEQLVFYKKNESYSGLEEFQQPEFEGYEPKTSKSVSEDISNEVRESPNALLVKELESDDKLENKIVFPTVAKIEFVRPKQQEKPVRKLVKYAKMYRLTAITIKGKGWPKAVNTARPNLAVVNAVRANQVNVVKASAGWVWIPTKLNSASITLKRHNYVDARGRSKLVMAWVPKRNQFPYFYVQGHPQKEDQGYVDSGCSRHMTGNMSYLSDFKEFDGGYVTFMCDKKNSVLFTDTGCFVLSPNFKLADESRVLLKVPRKNNMYSVNMKNIIPKESLTFLVAKFKNRVMCEFCEKKGIKKEFSVARTPQQNGVAKRRNRTLIEASNHVSDLSKFDGKSDEGFFVGYSLNSKAFRVYNIKTRKVEENLHIRFLEDKPIIAGDGLKWLFDIDVLTKSMHYVPVVAGTNSNNFVGTEESIGAGHSNKEIGSSKDYILMPLWKDGSLFDSSSKNASNDEPQPPSDVGKKDDEGVCKESGIADQKGLKTVLKTRRMTKTTNEQGFISSVYGGKTHEDLHTCLFACFLSQVEPKKKVWTLVDLPYGKRAIKTKWVYKNKKDKRGIVVRNKARLVAQGYTQEKGIDYDEVFTLVARIEAIRLFLAYASFMNFVVYQMDVKSAFLYGKIKEEVYVYQPLGFEDPEFPDRVYKVEKALYGLHQAPRAWFKTLSTYLLENGFQRGTIDKTLFIKKVKGDIILVQIYVDTVIFGSTKKELCTEFEKLMHKKFQMSSMHFLLRIAGDAKGRWDFY
ncbi:putative ribonuclease H-like domain-containing protein [Tanacetum coccineum]